MPQSIDTTTVIPPVNFRGSSYLQYDDTQAIDTGFIQEVRDSFKLCEEIAEETIGLTDLKFEAGENVNYLRIGEDAYAFPENGLAFAQYCSMLGVPAALAKKNPGELNEQLFAAHTELRTQRGEKETIVKYRYNPNTQKNELLAVLKGNYQTIKNSLIFESAMDALGGHVVVDRNMTNIDPFGQCYVRFLSPNFLPTSNDDKIFVAYDLQFSECADTGVVLGLGLWRQICSNGLAVPSLEGAEAYKHPYRGLDPTVPAYVLSRLLNEVLSNDAVGKRLAQRRDDLMLEQMDLQTSLERLAYHGTPNAFIAHIEETVPQDDSKSQWDLLNDLTQEAQNLPNLRRRRNLERSIGQTFGFTLAYDSPHKRRRSGEIDEVATALATATQLAVEHT